MKSFKEYLLEGQAEVDAAIKATDTALERENKIWKARRRLDDIIVSATKNTNLRDRLYYKLNRKAYQKVDQRVNPTLKKTFDNLSPGDRLQFLLTPHNSLTPAEVELHNKYTPGGAAGQTMYDKITRSGQNKMFPLKDLRDLEDFLLVVGSGRGRSFHPKDRNLTRIPKAQQYDTSDAGDAIVFGGTFHERKKLRKELNKRKSSKD